MSSKNDMNPADPAGKPGAASGNDDIARLLRALDADLRDEGVPPPSTPAARRGGFSIVWIALLIAAGLAAAVYTYLGGGAPAPVTPASPTSGPARAAGPEALITRETPGGTTAQPTPASPPAPPAPAAAAVPAAGGAGTPAMTPALPMPSAQPAPTVPASPTPARPMETATPPALPAEPHEPAKVIEPAKPEPAKIEAAKPEPVKAEPAKPAHAMERKPTGKPAPANVKTAPHPAEVKAMGGKRTESKPATETKPAAETKPLDLKPAQAKAVEAKPVEARPAEAKAPEPKAAETKPAGDGHFVVQAGSFKNADFAEDTLKTLKSHNYPAFLTTMTTKNGQTWRVVRVGPFHSDAEARKVADELRTSLKMQGQVITTR